MPEVGVNSIKLAYHNHEEVSSLRVGDDLVWEHPSLVRTLTLSTSNIQVPSWAVAISVALIGGGGGGQSGSGAVNGSGRPGYAANWSVYYKNLERSAGQSFHIDTVIGRGGSGGGNSDYAAGSNGEATTVKLWRTVGGATTSMGSYEAAGGQGASSSSSIPIGGISPRPDPVTAPREVPAAPYTLPRGASADKEQNGGSPGAGGGFGGGGLFGARGTGGNGGNGMAMLYFYGAPSQVKMKV